MIVVMMNFSNVMMYVDVTHRGTTLCRLLPFPGPAHCADSFGFPGTRESGNAIPDAIYRPSHAFSQQCNYNRLSQYKTGMNYIQVGHEKGWPGPMAEHDAQPSMGHNGWPCIGHEYMICYHP